MADRTLFAAFLLVHAGAAFAEEGMADVVDKIKPGVVAVGTYEKLRTPPADFRGTGFAVGDGLHVLTNAHVVPEGLDKKKTEILAIFVQEDGKEMLHAAELLEQDSQHDLALLRISPPALPALRLGNSDKVREGEIYAFTGYPIGMVLGLHPVTHRGMISSITPSAIPLPRAGQIDKNLYERLQDPYRVFQLDATVYPGNSGSPLYDPQSGEVVGIINKTFVQATKETLLSQPSGISYAIPIRFAEPLLKKAQRKSD